MLPPITINQTYEGAVTFNILLEPYADFRQLLTWQQNGIIQDVTGYTVVWTAISLTGVASNWNNYAALGAKNGLVTLDLPGAVTGALGTTDPPVRHDLLLIAPGTAGQVTRLLSGTVALSANVST